MRYTKIIGLLIYLLLIAVCFLPWTYHADLHKNFTGFFSENNIYGKPGKFFTIFSIVCILCIGIDKVWVKFTHLFFAGVIVAYALKTYHLYTSSYNAYSPEKLPGIYFLMILSILSLIIAVFPDLKIKQNKKGE